MKLKDLRAVFIVSGHGKYGSKFDPGAVANKTTERQEVVEIAQEAVVFLKNQTDLNEVGIFDIGVNENLSLAEKVKKVNDICNDAKLNRTNSILVSIHCNAGGGTGTEAWYWANSSLSRALGADIGKSMAGLTKLRYRGSKSEWQSRWGSLGIVSNTKPLAVLVECGFIDTIQDVKVLLDPEKDDGFAKGIVKGILNFVGGTYEEMKNGVFRDVKGDEWFYNHLVILKKLKIIKGYADNRFKASNFVNRAEVCKIIVESIVKSEEIKKLYKEI